MASQVFSIPLHLPNLSFLSFMSTEETSGTESDPEDNSKGINIELSRLHCVLSGFQVALKYDFLHAIGNTGHICQQ